MSALASFSGLRVAFVCDSLSPDASGGLVARRMIGALVAWGAEVHALSIRPHPGGVVPLPGATLREIALQGLRDLSLQHVIPGHLVREVDDWLESSRPHIVHVASFEYAKPRFIIDRARRAGARVVLQPWVHNFYCEQGYDLRAGRSCGRCAGGAFRSAWMSGCSPLLARAALHGVGRRLLRQSALHADAVYSTNGQLDDRLRAYGFPAERIIRGPLPFDPDRLEQRECSDGPEFVFHGQAKEMKGFHLLGGIVRACPGVRFGIYPLGASAEERRRGGLQEPVPEGTRFDPEIRWGTGLAERVASARAVLLPSVWPSTTEYALLEALGWGKPVVAFDVGVNREILVHRENAMVVPAGDVPAFAAAVRELDGDPELRRRVGDGARALFRELTSDGALQRALGAAYGVHGPATTTG